MLKKSATFPILWWGGFWCRMRILKAVPETRLLWVLGHHISWVLGAPNTYSGGGGNGFSEGLECLGQSFFWEGGSGTLVWALLFMKRIARLLTSRRIVLMHLSDSERLGGCGGVVKPVCFAPNSATQCQVTKLRHKPGYLPNWNSKHMVVQHVSWWCYFCTKFYCWSCWEQMMEGYWNVLVESRNNTWMSCLHNEPYQGNSILSEYVHKQGVDDNVEVSWKFDAVRLGEPAKTDIVSMQRHGELRHKVALDINTERQNFRI